MNSELDRTYNPLLAKNPEFEAFLDEFLKDEPEEEDEDEV